MTAALDTKAPATLAGGRAVRFEESGGGKTRRFKMQPAYSGLPVRQYPGLYVVDLSGLQIPRQQVPVLREHNRSQIVGHTSEIYIDDEDDEDELICVGILSSATAAGQEVARLSDEGFPWQASISFLELATEEIGPGVEREVNGRSVAGPAIIVTQSELQEVSVVPLGADPNTSTKAFSSAGASGVGGEAKQRWAAGANLRRMFGSEEEFAAYLQAESAGRCKAVGRVNVADASARLREAERTANAEYDTLVAGRAAWGPRDQHLERRIPRLIYR